MNLLRGRSRSAAQALALIVGSTLFALGGIECACRIALPSKPPEPHPQTGHEIVPARVKSKGRVAPEYLYIRPNQKCFSYDELVETNSLGLRNPDVVLPKPPGTFRILALGDSHTFGLGVPEPETWPRLLEGELRRLRPDRSIEVVNGGVASLAIEQEVQLFEDRLLQVSPDLVVLAYYWNDMPMPGDPDDPMLDGMTVRPASLRLSADPQASSGSVRKFAESPGESRRGRFAEWVRNTAKKSYLLYMVVQRVPAIQMRAYATTETSWKRATLAGRMTPRMEAAWLFVETEVIALRRLGEEHGFDLVILVIPLYEQMTASGYSTASFQGQVLRIGQRLGIPVVDPLPAIRADRPTYWKSFVPFDGHPKGVIYRRVAEVLSEQLLTHTLHE